SSAVGLLPLIGITLWSNLGSDPGALGRLSALLVLCVPAGFAYAIEVHQVFDFRWRPSRDRAVATEAVPTSPPVFAAADARSVIASVAADLHSRLGLAHCGVFRAEDRNGAVLATWLGDHPSPPAPPGLASDVSRALTRLSRPADLGEVGAMIEGTAAR